MKVSVDVYTKDIDSALEAYKRALGEGATDVRLNSSEDYETKEFQHLNLMFDADHTLPAMSMLDDGPFAEDDDEL